MERYLSPYIARDSARKIVLLSGPRQSGKTTLTKSLFSNFDYLNYDAAEDREAILKKRWKRDVEGVLFDELHKMPSWKRWLKGIYDTEGNNPHLLVTGSANLETFRKVGDSLAGRYFQYRLHPVDIKEGVTCWRNNAQEVFERLMTCSGFPEPFLEGNSAFYRRWQKSHLDIILRQDLLDMYSVRSIKSIEILTELLASRVSGSISYRNLAHDLEVDPKSIKYWLELLENIYAIFRVTPYHHNIARSLLKEPKVYFHDFARIADIGARLENLVASALLKEIQFAEDVYGYKGKLHYLKTKDGAEIDFLVVIDGKPLLAMEVKTTDDEPAKNFRLFQQFIRDIPYIQLVLNPRREFDSPTGVQVRRLVDYLAHFDLMDIIKKS